MVELRTQHFRYDGEDFVGEQQVAIASELTYSMILGTTLHAIEQIGEVEQQLPMACDLRINAVHRIFEAYMHWWQRGWDRCGSVWRWILHTLPSSTSWQNSLSVIVNVTALLSVRFGSTAHP